MSYLPTEDHNRKELASRKLDEEPCNHRLPNELRNVDYSADPAVFLANQVRVLDQAKHGGIAQGSLV